MREVQIRRHSVESPWTYSALDALQRQIALQIQAGGPGVLLLNEVAPVVTLGRRASEGSSQVALGGIPRCSVDRGGLATYHGPGQWVLFPVERLDRLVGDPRGVRKTVEALLEIARRTLLIIGIFEDEIEVVQAGPRLGVWVRGGKCASVGIHISNRVVLHGLSLNGFQTPESFLGVRPCGLNEPVGYALEGLGAQDREGAFVWLGECLVEQAQAVFDNFQAPALNPGFRVSGLSSDRWLVAQRESTTLTR